MPEWFTQDQWLTGAVVSSVLLTVLGFVTTWWEKFVSKYRPFFLAFIVFLGATSVICSLRQAQVSAGNHAKEIKRLQGVVTGGEAFCYLSISEISRAGWTPVAVHQGEYNLVGVDAWIMDRQDFDKWAANKEKTIQGFWALSRIIKIGDLPVGSARGLEPINTSSRINLAYDIRFVGRNGSWDQSIRIRLMDGTKWTTATRVVRESKTIYSDIDEDFPRLPNGEVAW